MHINVAVKKSEIFGAGLGVFSKKKFSMGDVMHTDYALLVPDMACSENVLADYVIPSDYPYNSLIILGPLSMLNDGTEVLSNVYLESSYDEYLEQHKVELIAIMDIAEGEELLLDYENIDYSEDE